MINEIMLTVPSTVAKTTYLIQGLYSGQTSVEENLNLIDITTPSFFRGIDVITDTDLGVLSMKVDKTEILPKQPLSFYPTTTEFNTGLVRLKKYDWGYPYESVSFQTTTLLPDSTLYTIPFYRFSLLPSQEVIASTDKISISLTGVSSKYKGIWGYYLTYITIYDLPAMQAIVRSSAQQGVC
jgi:hypothetical protein